MNRNNLKIGNKIVWLDPDGLASDVFTINYIPDDCGCITISNEFTELETFEEELFPLEEIKVCKHCNNIDIVKPLWIYSNGGKPSNFEESEQYYCNKCEKVILGEPINLINTNL